MTGSLPTIFLLLPNIALRYAYIRSNSWRRNFDFNLLSEAITMPVTRRLLHWGRYFTGYVLPPDRRKRLNLIHVKLGDGGGPVFYTGILKHYSRTRERTLDQLFPSGTT